MRLVTSSIPFVALVALAELPVQAEQFDATVVRVSTANVLEIRQDDTTELVALYGVTAPPSNSSFGKKAKTFVRERTLGKTLPVRVVGRQPGLTHVDIMLPSGRSLSHLLLRQGLVKWDSLSAPNDQGLRELERLARQERLGLWQHESSGAVAADPETYVTESVNDSITSERLRADPGVVESQVLPGEEGGKVLILRGNAVKDFGYEVAVEQARQQALREQREAQRRALEAQRQAFLEQQAERERQRRLQQQLEQERALEQLEIQNQRLLNNQLRSEVYGEPVTVPIRRRP